MSITENPASVFLCVLCVLRVDAFDYQRSEFHNLSRRLKDTG